MDFFLALALLNLTSSPAFVTVYLFPPIVYFVPTLAKVSLIGVVSESLLSLLDVEGVVDVEGFLSSLPGVVAPVESLAKVSVLVAPHTVHLNSFLPSVVVVGAKVIVPSFHL